jgi:hypothetical protein
VRIITLYLSIHPSIQVLALLMSFRQLLPGVSASLSQDAGGLNLLVELIDSHMLVVFLFANVLTGAVNMSIKTLYASDSMVSSTACNCGYERVS